MKRDPLRLELSPREMIVYREYFKYKKQFQMPDTRAPFKRSLYSPNRFFDGLCPRQSQKRGEMFTDDHCS
jgi:hypothetical protein